MNNMEIVKSFENNKIRTVWDKEEEKYYISVVDIIEVLTNSKDIQSYWRKLKQRLKEEGNETVTNCHALKLKAKDGKNRLTDVVDIEGMFLTTSIYFNIISEINNYKNDIEKILDFSEFVINFIVEEMER